jgi:hypothetical protein
MNNKPLPLLPKPLPTSKPNTEEILRHQLALLQYEMYKRELQEEMLFSTVKISKQKNTTSSDRAKDTQHD